MPTLVFFLEERSAQEMLQGLLPRLLPEITLQPLEPKFITFQGKQDLERNLERKLRRWLAPDSIFVVLRDRDASDCIAAKQSLLSICQRSGKTEALVRIACRELESFYLGDLAAVGRAFSLPHLQASQAKKKFRDPDRLDNPVQEIERLTGGAYQKISGSRAIAPYLALHGNTSKSFNALLDGLRKILREK